MRVNLWYIFRIELEKKESCPLRSELLSVTHIRMDLLVQTGPTFMNCLYRSSILICLIAISPSSLSTQSFAQTEEVRKQEQAEANAFFEDAHSALDSALEMFEEQGHLPGEKDLAFYDFLSHTKESQQKRIESYLDAASESLGISKMSDRRNKIADLRKQIEGLRSSITIYERKKISAPETSYNPLVTTRKKYDSKIKNAREDMKAAKAEIEHEKARLVKQLNDIGMKLDPQSADKLLESNTGDEFVRVSIVFDNAKRMARELEQLTEKTGEDLEAAKRYYGVYLMLLKTVARLQNQFVQNVDNSYYPDIDAYAQRAQRNISEARKAIKLGGNREVLERNIASNQTMYEAAMIHKQELSHQKHQMMMANLETKKNILTAANTYKTVELSKDVVSLMAVSRRAFDSISNLSVPDMRPFQNEKMKDAFRSMVRDLKK